MALNIKRLFVSITLSLALACLFSVNAFAVEFVEVTEKNDSVEQVAETQEQQLEEDSSSVEEDIEVEQDENGDMSFMKDPVYPQNIDTKALLNIIPAKTATYIVIDIETGKSFEAVRYGGNKHLDTEPKTQDGADIMESFGKSWDRRAIIVYYQGNFYAASMNTMPHGSGKIKTNGFNGHFCIHVKGSKTHGGNKVCDLHQAMVDKAYNTDLNSIPATAALIANETIPTEDIAPVNATVISPEADDADEEYSTFVITDPQN